MTGEEAIARFYIRLAERSEDSANQLSIEARVFLRHSEVSRIEEITPAHLESYRSHLADRAQRVPKGKRLALSTMTNYLAHLKIFLLFCAEQDWLSIPQEEIRARLAAKPARVERPYEILSEDEIMRVMAAADARQRALLALGLYAGLRINEIAHLQMGDIVDDEARGLCFLLVRRGKGNKDRTVPLARDVYALLHSYCGARRPEQPVFLIGRYQCRKVIVQAVRQAGIERRITPHSLRHTYAYRLAKAGVPLLAIRAMLGHRSIETTMRYIDHLTASQVAQYAPSLVQ